MVFILPAYNFGDGFLQYEILCDKISGEKYVSIEKAENIEGDIVLPSEIDGIPVGCIGPSAFYNNEKITSVIIPDTVKEIKNNAFAHCYSLKTVTLPKDLNRIRYSLFTHCDSLASISIPQNCTDIESYAFEFCEELKTVIFNEKLINIGHSAFFHCAVENIKFPNSVEYIGFNAFARSKLKNISFGKSLKMIDDNAFTECERLKCVELNDGLKSIGGEVFYGCKKLKSLIIPDSVEVLGKNALFFCESLENIHIGKSTIIIGTNDCFCYGCSSLQNISVSKDNKKYISDNGVLYNKDKSLLIKVFPKTPYKTIVIPDTVKEISKLSMCNISEKKIKFKGMNISGLFNSALNDYNRTSIYCLPGSDVEKYCIKKMIKYNVTSKLNTFLENIDENTNIAK